MGEVAAVVSIASAAVGGFSAYEQHRESSKAASKQREANRVQANQQKINQFNERRKAARMAAIQRAAMDNAAVQAGTQGSSGLQGAIGANQTIDAGSEAALSGAFQASDYVTSQLASASRHSSAASKWGAIGGLAGQVGSIAAPNASFKSADVGKINTFGTQSSFNYPNPQNTRRF